MYKNTRCHDCVLRARRDYRASRLGVDAAQLKSSRDQRREAFNAQERSYVASCRDGMNAKSKRWRDGNGTWQMMHTHAKNRAVMKGIEFTLTVDDLQTLNVAQNGRCALTNIPFSNSAIDGCVHRPFRPSPDRINNMKGYTPDNVQLVTVMVNRAKNQFPQEMFDAMCRARVKVLDGKA